MNTNKTPCTTVEQQAGEVRGAFQVNLSGLSRKLRLPYLSNQGEGFCLYSKDVRRVY